VVITRAAVIDAEPQALALTGRRIDDDNLTN
jgi:hypothetical protein